MWHEVKERHHPRRLFFFLALLFHTPHRFTHVTECTVRDFVCYVFTQILSMLSTPPSSCHVCRSLSISLCMDNTDVYTPLRCSPYTSYRHTPIEKAWMTWLLGCLISPALFVASHQKILESHIPLFVFLLPVSVSYLNIENDHSEPPLRDLSFSICLQRHMHGHPLLYIYRERGRDVWKSTGVQSPSPILDKTFEEGVLRQLKSSFLPSSRLVLHSLTIAASVHREILYIVKLLTL